MRERDAVCSSQEEEIRLEIGARARACNDCANKTERLISVWIGVRSRSISEGWRGKQRQGYFRVVSSGVSCGVGCWVVDGTDNDRAGFVPAGRAIRCEIIRRVYRRACRRKSRFKSLLIEPSLARVK